MQSVVEHSPKIPRTRWAWAMHPKAAKNAAIYFSVLFLAVLLVVACSACTATTGTEVPPATFTPTSTHSPQAIVSGADPTQSAPSTPGGASPDGTSATSVADVVASRTPEPTMAPGAVEEAVSDITAAAGVADTPILGLTTDDWINLAISVLMVLLTVAFAGPVLKRVLRRMVKTTSTDLDDRLVAAVLPQLRQFLLIIIIDLATMRLDFLGERLRTLLGDIYFLLFAAILGYALWRLLGVAVDWYDKEVVAKTKDETDQAETDTKLSMVRHVGQILIIVVCTSLVLEHLGVHITAVAASFGLIALALSLAAQDTLSDVINGFLIGVDQPFRVGDRIEIQDINTWGDVVNIGTRTTRIRTGDNRLVIVPNSVIGKNEVVNYSYPDPRYRVQVELGIGYDADIVEARRIIEDAVRTVDGVLPDKPVHALFMEFGDSAMTFRVRWWIESYTDTAHMFDKVNEVIYKELSAAGVDMPFTTYDVNVTLDTEDAERFPGALRAEGQD